MAALAGAAALSSIWLTDIKSPADCFAKLTISVQLSEAAMEPFNQPSGTFTIYDPGYPRTTPDTATLARAAAVKFEESIRHDTFETGAFFNKKGQLLLLRTGQADRVSFEAHELTRMRQCVFTHNHPLGLTFSVDDIILASEIGLLEVRAVAPWYRHVMFPISAWPLSLRIQSAYTKELVSAEKDVDTMVKSGELAAPYATAEMLHLAWVRAALKLQLRYEREAS